ncbi:MAG: EMC3/TMCO1 family protein [Candidatus Nanoarchaeia archaeon]
MGILDIFSPSMDVLFGWLLGWDPLYAVLVISVGVSLFIVLIQKYTTDQDLMKRLKGELKELQSEAKSLREHPEKAMAVNKQMMETNMKYMMQSMRSTIFTLLPIFLMFGWMSANFAYVPLDVGTEFTVSGMFTGDNGEVSLEVPEGISLVSEETQTIAAGKAEWALKGEKVGEYLLKYEYKDKTYTSPVIITSQQEYAPFEKIIDSEGFDKVVTNYKKLEILPWLNWGWLGSYIVFSILGSMIFRKWFDVY